MRFLSSTSLSLALALFGGLASGNASACTSGQCNLSRQQLCLWDEGCNLRAFQPRLNGVKWEPVHPVSLRSFTRMDIEAVRLFQRMP